jgi:hypothetical protein
LFSQQDLSQLCLGHVFGGIGLVDYDYHIVVRRRPDQPQ